MRISESLSGSHNSGSNESSTTRGVVGVIGGGSGPVTPRGVLPSWSDRSSCDTWGDGVDMELRQATLHGGDAMKV